jgi:hypothetical protein
MIVSRTRPSRLSSAFYFIPFCTNTSILSVERPSTQYAISLTIPWDTGDPGMPCKLNLLPCAKAQTPAPANAHFASFLDVPTLSWIFRRMQSFGCSKMGYRIDRVSRFVPPLSPISHSQSIMAIGPARGTSRFGVLSHLFRSTPNRTVLITHVPHVGHPPVSPPRAFAQIPHHPHPTHDLPSPTIPTPPPSFALFPPRPDYTLCRLGTNPNCGEAFPGYTKLHIPPHSEWRPTR